ncbi:Plug domain-containing protein [Roseivirga sp. E12]|uniref:Plug domain-containing protein n=1 Tax=Roseivirga sp. E12 TaxID=2819237 RepID=UPI001ABC278B|nr:Plug domain-containing protein [Roseivirga sp. E12]MBO3699645.1 Plug domain-containing protein [Roseivirga sp. E12]
MKRAQLLTLLLFICFQTNSSYAQRDSFQDWLKSFQNYQMELPTEKVFLHLDKSEYTLGETIWMKSYLVAGAGHIPSPFSQNVYVELIDEKDEVKKRLTLRSEEGVSKASLALTTDLQPGFYYLRSYTNWMKNQGEEFFFKKRIKVHSLKLNEAISPIVAQQKVDLKFYPEGGDLVNGISSKVAFEVTGINESKLPVSGKVFDRNQQEIATFVTEHEGKGVFAMLPNGDDYYAQLDGSDTKYDIPKVKPEGMTLSVTEQTADYLGVALKTAEPANENYYLMVHTRGYVTYASEITVRNTKNLLKIDKSELPNGIAHLTLFDQDMEPVAERLVFNYSSSDIKIDISTSNPQYTSRDLATINLKVTDKKGNPVQGSFSLSAFDSKLVQNDQFDYNIAANLLLTSDLGGYIKNPSQYLKQDEQSKANTDLLMMVNGWRRFKWSSLNLDKRQPEYAFEQSLTLEGVMTRTGGKAFKNGRVFLLNKEENGKNKSSRFVEADLDGNFAFENLVFYDTTELTLQGFQKKKARDIEFNINNDYEVIPNSKFLGESAPDNPDRLRALKESVITSIRIDSTYRKENGIIYLDDVYVTANKREEKYRTLNSQYGKGEAYLNFDNLSLEEKHGRDPFTVMLGRLAGFSLSGSSAGNNGNSLGGGNSGSAGSGSIGSDGSLGAGAIRPSSSGGGSFTDNATVNDPMFRKPTLRPGPFQGGPLILIDNVPVPYTAVYDLRATEIDYVEVYKSASAAMFGVNGFNGAMAFYTLKGDKLRKAMNLKPGMRIITGNGYHAAREFYAPKYDESNKEQFIPDERSTIFWAPMITTDSEGKAQIEFYTHDKNSNVFIDVQGISKTGFTGVGSAQFAIRRNL